MWQLASVSWTAHAGSFASSCSLFYLFTILYLNHSFVLSQEPSYAEHAHYHGLIPLGAKLKFDEDWEVFFIEVCVALLDLYFAYIFCFSPSRQSTVVQKQHFAS